MTLGRYVGRAAGRALARDIAGGSRGFFAAGARCGVPFGVGSQVAWHLRGPAALGSGSGPE